MRFLLLSILLLFFSACFNEPDCVVTASSLVKISMKTIKKSTDTIINFTNVSVSGTDAIFYQDSSASRLTLPLNPHTESTRLILRYGTEIDSIILQYSPLNVIISPNCGAYVYYTNLAIDTTSLDNCRVVNNQLSTSATVNIEIKL